MQVNLHPDPAPARATSPCTDVGDTEAAQRYFRKADRDQPGVPGEEARQRRVTRVSWPIRWASSRARNWRSVISKRPASSIREEIAVRESFSPAEAKDWESRRELAGHYAAAGDTGRADGRPCRRPAALRPDARRSASRWRRKSPTSGRPRTISPWRTTIKGRCVIPYGGDPKAAREFHRKALRRVQEAGPGSTRSDFDNKQTLARTLYYEATCALHSGDKDGAAAGFRECLKICKELATEPKAKMPQADLMLALARCGDHAGAAKIAEALVATPPKDEALYVQAACGFALAAAPPPAATPLWSSSYTDRGPRLLAQGQGKRLGGRRGPRDRYRPRTDPQRAGIPRLCSREFRRPGEKRP